MRDDIKKKFLDILFEPEPEPVKPGKVIVKAPLQDISAKKEVNEVKEPVVQVKKTPFINLKEEKKEEINIEYSDVKEKINKGYEYTQNISPIFGVIEEPQKKTSTKIYTDDSQTSKPVTSYLGTIISPIYGYDANKSQKSYEEYKQDMEKGPSTKKTAKKETQIDELLFEEEKNEDIVEAPQEDYYSPEDDQLFKELSISDIFKSDDEINEDKPQTVENKKEEKVTYTSLFDEKEGQ